MKQIRKMTISLELLTEFLRGEVDRPSRVEGMPADARVVGLLHSGGYTVSVDIETSEPGGDIIPVYHRDAEPCHESRALAKEDRGAVANAILALRVYLCLSQEGLAKRIGITGPAIARYEAGRRQPKAKVLASLASLAQQVGLTPTSHIFETQGLESLGFSATGTVACEPTAGATH